MDLYPSYAVIRDCYSEPVPPKTLVALGWGAGSFHLHLVYDLLKYDPADLLHLFDKTSSKKERMDYLMAQGISFADKPATLKDSILMVLFERKVLLEADRKLSDEDIQYGIIDAPDKTRTGNHGHFRYANDASPDGSFVDGHHATLPLWVDDDAEEED